MPRSPPDCPKVACRAAFAEPLGVNDHKIKHIETGKQRADHEVLAALRTVYGVDLNSLFDEYVEPSLETVVDPIFVAIPKLSVSKNGTTGNSFVSDKMDVIDYAFRADWLDRRGLKPENLRVITVKGDSMEPKLHEGDLLLVDYSDNAPSDGSTYVVRVMDDLVVKNVQHTGMDTIALISANNTYPARELKYPADVNDFEIMGRVVASMHEW